MYRAAAVITFVTGDDPVDVFAVPEVEIADWSTAAWTDVPFGGPVTYTAYRLNPSGPPPTLFVAQRSPGGMSIRVMRVSPGLPTAPLDVEPVSEAPPLPSWCESESWISGFFIEGVGAPPDQPIVLEHRSEGSGTRLLIDPARSTVRANAGLTVTPDQLQSVEEYGGYRVVHVQLARTSTETFPLVVQMVGDSARVASGGRSQSIDWGMGDQGGLDMEWRVYFLSAVPGSDPASRELPECAVGA
jgi:hypothetical protein